MKKNQLYAIIITSTLFFSASPIWCFIQPLKVEIINQAQETELSKASAEFLTFIKDGIKSTWFRYFALQDREAELAKGSKTDKANAVLSAAFRGILIATPPLMGIVILQGAKIGFKTLERNIFIPKPAILNNTQKPFYGPMDRFYRWLSKAKTHTMIFNQETGDRLIEIEKKAVSLKNLIKNGKNRTYANLLLYGAPGTGKTFFAQILATKTNMNFLPVTAASLLQAGVEGIKYFDEIITMANNSTYGTIIFIDEADALFTDRDTINPDSDHYKILNHILSVIDGRSNKFMIVAATNHAVILDPAMERRFQDQICVQLPDTATRQQLFEYYIAQLLCNPTQTSIQFVNDAQSLFTPSLITELAAQTINFSPSEIADTVSAIRNKAELNNRSIIKEDIDNALQEAVEKKKNYQKIIHTKKTQ